jgi:hypothetical protein
MDRKLFGLARVVHCDGADVSRRSRPCSRRGGLGTERPAAALRSLPDCLDNRHIAFSYRLVHAGCQRPRKVDRPCAMGDPDSSGKSDRHPFGFDATGYATFNGLTIPSVGPAGWFIGTDRWREVSCSGMGSPTTGV